MRLPVPSRRAANRSLRAAALLLSLTAGGAAQAGGTLVVGMTAGDIPVTTGNPDQGFEGYRFVGYNLYDSLLLWDLSKSDKPSELRARPGDLGGCRSEATTSAGSSICVRA